MKERKVMAQPQVERSYGRLTEGHHVAARAQRPHVAVLGLLVPPEVHLPLECPATHVTRERLVAFKIKSC